MGITRASMTLRHSPSDCSIYIIMLPTENMHKKRLKNQVQLNTNFLSEHIYFIKNNTLSSCYFSARTSTDILSSIHCLHILTVFLTSYKQRTLNILLKLQFVTDES